LLLYDRVHQPEQMNNKPKEKQRVDRYSYSYNWTTWYLETWLHVKSKRERNSLSIVNGKQIVILFRVL